jgi:hypothetical protein
LVTATGGPAPGKLTPALYPKYQFHDSPCPKLFKHAVRSRICNVLTINFISVIL